MDLEITFSQAALVTRAFTCDCLRGGSSRRCALCWLLKARQGVRCRQAQNLGETGAARLLSFVRRVSGAHGHGAWGSMPAVCLIRRGASHSACLACLCDVPPCRPLWPLRKSILGPSPEPGRAARCPSPLRIHFPGLSLRFLEPPRSPRRSGSRSPLLLSAWFPPPHVCTTSCAPQGQRPPPTSGRRRGGEASLLSRLLRGPLSRAWARRRAPLG